MHWLDERDQIRGIGQAANKFDPNTAMEAFPTSSWNPLAMLPAMVLDKKAGNKEKKDFKAALPTAAQGLANFAKVSRLLQQAGITGDLNSWASAQALFETNNLKSAPAKYFNYSNIAYTPNSPFQSGRGYKNWAGYRNGLQWAKDYKRVINLHRNGTVIAGATSLPDFVARLYQTGYVDGKDPKSAPESVYRQALASILIAKHDVPATAKAYEAATGDKVNLKTGKIKEKNYWEKHPMITGALVIVGGVVAIKVISD